MEKGQRQVRMAWGKPRLPNLSPRQREVLQAWWAGEPPRQTAQRLEIALSTVMLHRKLARAFFRAPTMLVAVRRAMNKRMLWETKQ